MRVFVVGATGYIGRHVVRTLVDRGHQVVCLARPRAGVGGVSTAAQTREDLAGAQVRFGEVTDRDAVDQSFGDDRFEAVISCLASRTGGAQDARRVEYEANLNVLGVAKAAGVRHFVLLSAICVQKPRLAFQKAKLAFEERLICSGIDYTIVRPTAFFKSLSGQVARVQAGRPYMVFGNGRLTACKPISEPDLAAFIVDCLVDPSKRNAVLPIGGPGPALTPHQQGELLFSACGRAPRFRRIPVVMFDVIIFVLSALSRVFASAKDKAEFARIGRYYATESMLVWNESTQRYDANATPSFGSDTLAAFYRRAVTDGLQGQELGDHKMY